MRKPSIGMFHIYITHSCTWLKGKRWEYDSFWIFCLMWFRASTVDGRVGFTPFCVTRLRSENPRWCSAVLNTTRAPAASQTWPCPAEQGPGAVPRHSQLPAVKVSILCPQHLLFTKAYTHLHKQMNNSIMCLAARALSFCCTIEAPHWKDPYTGEKKSKQVSSKHTYYQSLIST